MKYTQLKLINEIYTCKLNEVISQEHTHTIMKLLSMIYKGKLMMLTKSFSAEYTQASF